ncbi:DegT/DnrJ/EryC1/StrS family aminotransferase [Paucibacter sp. APW11]|uniref:DegT/DnrJ/EryC1/StrS family aminotransferase n=1 Tax=Roseateles aquae TaxID=3077235 RepID=A0ABU3P5T3_9BURK|nr:DegT/DnrJ/EryC1/StrS family aminotransferase [Paucibacter sp. APW11]MDT8997936.1 DegT/DnrJ/EryC1/StrS family aminotransferase [Paucibacter sp. APW11]
MDILGYQQPAGGFAAPCLPVRADRPWGTGQGAMARRWPRPEKELRFYPRARYAMAAALHQFGVAPGDAVLLPSYHCLSLLAPVLHLGARPVFYALDAELRPRMDSVKHVLGRQAGVRTVVASHFFGRDAELAALRALCDEHGLPLLEDCAHLHAAGVEWLAMPGRESIGRLGDLVVASPSKFVPALDGGLLWAGRGVERVLPAALPSPSWGQELRGFLSLMRPPARQALTQRFLQRKHVASQQGEGSHLTAVDASSAGWAPAAEGRSGLRLSSHCLRRADHEALGQRRREHAARWIDALSRLLRVRPWVENVKALGPAPYMLPVLVDEPASAFAALKAIGFPLGRWDSLARSDCEVAAAMRLGLFHLPCHQQLTGADMDWLCATFAAVVESA